MRDVKNIGLANLKRLVTERGMSYSELAEACDTSPSTLSQIVSDNARRNLGDELARRIEMAMKLPRGYLDNQHASQLAEEFSFRLRERMAVEQLRAVDIQRRIGVSPGTVSFWVNGISAPSGANLHRLADLLKCSPGWLMSGEGAGPGARVSEPGFYPVIGWDDVLGYRTGEDQTISSRSEHYAASASAESFWLVIRSDVMTSGDGISMPVGSLIFVDPEVAVTNGNFVVVKIANDVTCRRFVADAGEVYLNPLNLRYNSVVMQEDHEVIGVVRECRIKC